MAETDIPVLTDRQVLPTPALLHSILGEKMKLWDRIIRSIKEDYAGTEEVWRFYNDGKQWLFRLIRKKNTVCWIGVVKDAFRVTFYFGDKAEPLIEGSDLPEKIINDFRTGKHYGKIRGISLKISGERDVDTVLQLAAIKMQLK